MSNDASSWLRRLKTVGQSEGFLTFAQVNASMPLSIVDPVDIVAVVEFERALIRQRTEGGLRDARKSGVLFGRPPW